MSSIKLNTTSGGSIALVPQDTASNVTVTLPASTSTLASGTALAASSGSSLVGFLQSGTGAVATTVQTKLRESVSVKDFGATGDGVTDDTAAIQAALNSGAKTVQAVGGTYVFSSQLTVPAYVIFEGDGKYATVLNKAFNGDALILGTGAILRGLQIDGNGGTYTGRGVLINSGATNQTIDQCRITDFNNYCVEFTAASAGSGFQMTPGTELSRTTPGDVAVKLPTDVSASPRHFNGVNASSSVLIDTAGADNTLITGCFARNIIFGTTSAKVICVGNRLATVGSNCVVQGVNQIFTGNDVAGTIEAGSSLTSSTISGNYPGPVLDSSLSRSNTIDNVYFDFTPVWTAASVNPSLGNGTLTGRLVRTNRLVKVTMYLTIGSTTTTGTGVWTFALPASLSWMTASKLAIGSCYGLRSGVNFQVGVSISNTDPNTFGVILLSHAGGNNWGPTTPVTWASGDYVRMDVTFELA